MSRLKELNGLGVVPGDTLCVIEEFLPGNWTYDYDNVVRATVVGRVVTDLRSRIINVKPTVKTPQLPSKGEVVYAVVTLLYDDVAITKVSASESGRKYPNPFTGLLHISQVQEGYIKNFYEVLAVGDVIKAKVLNNNTPYILTIKEPKLGVVLAYCNVCGSLMKKHLTDTLKCSVCGNLEKRKLSINYSSVRF
jgi:exosome complex component CSL4